VQEWLECLGRNAAFREGELLSKGCTCSIMKYGLENQWEQSQPRSEQWITHTYTHIHTHAHTHSHTHMHTHTCTHTVNHISRSTLSDLLYWIPHHRRSHNYILHINKYIYVYYIHIYYIYTYTYYIHIYYILHIYIYTALASPTYVAPSCESKRTCC